MPPLIFIHRKKKTATAIHWQTTSLLICLPRGPWKPKNANRDNLVIVCLKDVIMKSLK